MQRRSKLIAAAAAAVIAAGIGTGIAVAGAGDDDRTERSITGAALRRASAAALEYTGGGRVTETEVSDEESYYEVEVVREDGRQVDVQLDRAFNVVSSEGDDDSREDGED